MKNINLEKWITKKNATDCNSLKRKAILHPFNSILLSISFLVILFQPNPICAQVIKQVPKLEIHHAQQDKVLGVIRAITQDKTGFLWIASSTGLYKYDGTEFKKVPLQETAKLYDILTDQHGNIWIATLDKGLYKFAPATQELEIFNSKNSTLPSNSLSKLALQQSQLWIATNKGVALLNTDTLIFSEQSKHSPAQLLQESIVDTAIDSLNRLWILTFDKGVYRWDQHNQELVHYSVNNSGTHFISNSKASSLFVDDRDRVWLAGFNGLEVYNDERSGFESLINFDKIAINSVKQDQTGDYWITSWEQGLFHIAKTDVTISKRQVLPTTQLMPATPFADTFEDLHHNLWFSSGNKLFKLSPLSRALKHYQLPTISSCPVKGFNQLHGGQLMFGCGDKLYVSDNHQHMNFKAVTTVNNEIYAITSLDKNSSLLSFYREDYLASYNHRTNQLSYYYPGRAAAGLKGGVPLDIYTDSQHRVWVGTYAAHQEAAFGNLYLYDKQQDKFIPHLQKINVLSIVELDPDNLLLLTPKGPVRYQISNKELTTNSKADVFISRVNDIYQDKQGIIWISLFERGLYQIEPQSLSLIPFKPEANIPLSEITGITGDETGNIWMVSENGLFKYDKQQNLLSFSKEDSSSYINRYSRNSAFTTTSGLILFAGENAFLSFSPAQVDLSTQARLAISEFKITSNDAQPEYIHQINQLQSVDLSHQDQFFTARITPLDYATHSNFQYFFQLEGLNEQWIEINPLSKDATFSTLPAGEYKFHYKAQAHDQTFYGRPLTITVAPPPWQTPQAYAVYLLLLLVSVYFAIRVRTRALQRYSKNLETEVRHRTHSLKQKTNKVQQLLNEKKQLFANISHEFRTPLSLIIGPMEQLQQQQLNSENQQCIAVAIKNAKRLVKVLDQTLELSRLDNFSQLQPVHYKLKDSIQQTLSLFEEEAEKRQIRLQLQAPSELELQLLQDSLEKIIANLVSNALKYSPENTEITLNVSVHEQLVCIEVRDQGIGIDPREIEHVFSAFTRLAQGHTMSVEGSGLGLSIVKELVEANGGTIQVSSQPGEGSSFIIQLPLGTSQSASQSKQQLSQSVHNLLQQQLQLSNSAQELGIDTTNFEDKKPEQVPELLIIEDNNELRHFLAGRLEQKFKVLQASNGTSGIELAAASVPDLVICDVMMDGLNGYQVSQQLRDNPKTSHVPIILLTARVDRQSRLKGWQSHVDEYITKPFSVIELQLRIYNLLSIRKLLREQAGNQLSYRKPDLSQSSSRDNLFIESFEKAIAAQYQNPDLRRADIAKSLAMSERQLNRKLSSLVNNSFSDYLRKYRLRKAVELFGRGLQVNQLCYEVGFNTPSYFISCFKEEFGMTVKEYERQLHQVED